MQAHNVYSPLEPGVSPNLDMTDVAEYTTSNILKYKSVWVFGVNDAVFPITVNGVSIPSYTAWKSMLQRCYSTQFQIKNTAYVGCSVCPEWFSFCAFHTWYVAHHRENYALDKDILVPGNKVYGPDVCCFVPQRINSILLGTDASRGALPRGVSYSSNRQKFRVSCCISGSQQHIGYFTDLDAAVVAYSASKKRIVTTASLKAYIAGEIDLRVHIALCRREW